MNMLGIEKANSELNILNVNKDDQEFKSFDLKDKNEKKSQMTYQFEMVDLQGNQFIPFGFINTPNEIISQNDFQDAR